jgi:selT/selW/selH-like putative selenoprotein
VCVTSCTVQLAATLDFNFDATSAAIRVPSKLDKCFELSGRAFSPPLNRSTSTLHIVEAEVITVRLPCFPAALALFPLTPSLPPPSTPHSAKYMAIKKALDAEFPGKVNVVGEPTPNVSGALEVVVEGKGVVHSKKGGDGYVDTPEKMQKIKDAVKSRVA